jgi:single-stranded-DNA-specific exonuclease
MQPAATRWILPPEDQALAVHPELLGRILGARGMTAAEAQKLLDRAPVNHNPLKLTGMSDAVAVIKDAVARGERIAIYGDFDCDGVSACALLTRALRRAGADVIPYIPNRMTEGYGLHSAALQELADQGVTCVVSVDCGTSSVDVALNRPKGMRLVVTDHHLPLAPNGAAPALAPADALVNPMQPGDAYPFHGLAGVGVAWKLLQALERARVVPRGCSEEGIQLAILGTIGDVMPLTDENRSMVRRGLEAMTTKPLPGVQALLEAAKIGGAPKATDLAFGVIPAINAAGRLADARLALDLCLAETVEEARPLAAQLFVKNTERKQAVAQAVAEAEAQVALLPEDAPAIVLASPGWHMGIVGIVAGRLAEKYARPTFVVSLQDPHEAK